MCIFLLLPILVRTSTHYTYFRRVYSYIVPVHKGLRRRPGRSPVAASRDAKHVSCIVAKDLDQMYAKSCERSTHINSMAVKDEDQTYCQELRALYALPTYCPRRMLIMAAAVNVTLLLYNYVCTQILVTNLTTALYCVHICLLYARGSIAPPTHLRDRSTTTTTQN